MSLRIGHPLPCRLLASASAFPTRLPGCSSPELENEAVIRLLSPEGKRGPRSEDEIRELAAALAESLGVVRRRWSHRPGAPHAPEEETTVDLQSAALASALAAAPDLELGALLAATSTPPRVTAGCAPSVAARLGLRCAAFDLRAGCAGGIHALVQGALLAGASGQAVAVVAGDTFSKLVPPGVPLAALAMGDGAAALLLGAGEAGHAGILAACLDADGSLGHLGTSPSPFPPSHEAIDAGLYLLTGDPEELARQAPPRYEAVCRDALALAGLGLDAVDLLIPHQAGRALSLELGRRLGLPRERVLAESERHANIGSASVLVALHEAITEGRLRRGQRALLAALGGGLSWGAAILEL